MSSPQRRERFDQPRRSKQALVRQPVWRCTEHVAVDEADHLASLLIKAEKHEAPSVHARSLDRDLKVCVLVTIDGRLVSIMRFTVRDGKIVVIEAFTDPDRLNRLRLTAGEE
jgi:hypothetical protein